MLMRVRIATELPDEDRLRLVAALRSVATIEEEESRGFAPTDVDWVTLIGVVKDVGSIAGASASVLKLANELLEWRRRARAQGTRPEVRLEAAGRPRLELATASDSAVREWFGGAHAEVPGTEKPKVRRRKTP